MKLVVICKEKEPSVFIGEENIIECVQGLYNIHPDNGPMKKPEDLSAAASYLCVYCHELINGYTLFFKEDGNIYDGMKTTTLYPEDYHSTNDWEAVCDTLGVPHDSCSIDFHATNIVGGCDECEES